MPSIKPVTLSDGKTKVYRFVVDTGRDPITRKRIQKTFTFGRMKDAKAELARITHEVKSGTYVAPWDGDVAAVIDSYLQSSGVRKRTVSTQSNYAVALKLPASGSPAARRAPSPARTSRLSPTTWPRAAASAAGSRAPPFPRAACG